MNRGSDISVANEKKAPWLVRFMSVEWLGQTIASICWIISVFVYGITSFGDWFQLFAGFSWLIANIASLFTTNVNDKKN